MTTQSTAAEVKQQCIDAMGDSLGRLYHELSNEIAWLYIKWSEYVELFGIKPSRIELLNTAAGGFFRVVQDSLWDDVLMHIARLTDRPQTMGRSNLTICALPPLVMDLNLRSAVQARIDTCIEVVAFSRDWRNRKIAHIDLKLALEEGAEPLMPASRANVKHALEAFTDVLNVLSGAYLSSTTVYDSLENSAGALGLLYVIDDGLRAEQERRTRLQTRKYLPDDYKPRDL